MANVKMTSLYGKILLWATGILLLSWAAFLLLSRLSWYEAFGENGDLGALISMQFDEADRIYLNEGKTALASYLQTLDRSYPGDYYYMANRSRDLLTGADLSRLTAVANSRWNIIKFNSPMVFSVSRPSKGYALVLIGRRQGLADYVPYYSMLLCAVAALGWILTLQFALPLKKLMQAVERFGTGDLAARARIQRGDEIGALAQAFDRMADRIETLLGAERRLLQDISHELRSPLTRLTVALKVAENSSDRQAASKQINKETQRIVNLLESSCR